MVETVSNMPVKEREDPDWCRHCGRPTWSMQRRCVRCKRAGKTGMGVWPSRHARDTAARRLWGFAAFFVGHMITTTALVVSLFAAAGGRLPPMVLMDFLVPSILFGLLDGIGYAVACAMTKRVSFRYRSRYYWLSLTIGGLVALAGCGTMFLVSQTQNPPSTAVTLLILIALSASLSQLILAIGFATGFLTGFAPPADKSVCGFCGFDFAESTDFECPHCGERRERL